MLTLLEDGASVNHSPGVLSKFVAGRVMTEGLSIVVRAPAPEVPRYPSIIPRESFPNAAARNHFSDELSQQLRDQKSSARRCVLATIDPTK
jgi:hypothetical protein